MPKVSVIMSTYNRDIFLKEAVNSVLNQTFSDFEFIIINDNSEDKTEEILNLYNDKRLKIFTNKVNCGCTFNYHNAQNLAGGEFIAHIDDDDIWFENKLKKQIEYMENNPDITLVGTFVETFGENKRPSWVFDTNPDKINFLMNFYNPICHSAVIYRNSFIKEKGINYDFNKLCAQDYDFYKQILMNNGKISNIPEILVHYRMHKKRLTDIKETQNIQINNADKIKRELLERFLNSEEINEIKNLTKNFPFYDYSKENVISAIDRAGNIFCKRFNVSHNIIEQVKNDVKNNVYKFG